MGKRSSSFWVSLLSSMTLVTSSGCVRLDESHCIVNGGDFACGDGWRCATEREGIVESRDQGDGCLPMEGLGYDLEKYFVHVQYGLPEVLWPRGEPEDDLDSLGGVLVHAVEERHVEDVCRVQESKVLQFEAPWREVAAIRTFLERPTRVRVDAARLESFQVMAIEGFNEVINEWLDECEGMAEGG